MSKPFSDPRFCNSMTLLLLVLALTYLVNAQTNDFCSPTACPPNKGPHIACGNNGQFSPICPPDAIIIDLSPHTSTILRLHNEKRNKIAGGYLNGYPPAVRMLTMEWDQELAEMAAFNVKRCLFEYDKCHSTKAFRYSGQNLNITSFSGSNISVKKLIKRSIEYWYEEHKTTNMGLIKSYRSNQDAPFYRHFILMINDKNAYVGCAASSYSTDKQYFLFVCNYAIDNMEGKEVYDTKGRTASRCRTGTNRLFKYLCSTDELQYTAEYI